MTVSPRTHACATPSPGTASRRVRMFAAVALMLASTAGCARQGTDVNQAFENPGNAQFADAIVRGDESLARELLAAGANPNALGERDEPLLHWVMKQEDRDGFRLLLALGADPARGNAEGRTALHLAAMGKSPYWLETLLAQGMSPDTRNTITGATPLYDALRAGSEENVDLLLRAGASVGITDRNRATVLHQAALVNNTAAVLKFLEAGADPAATDRTGATFRDYLPDNDPALLNASVRRDMERIEAWLQDRE